MTEKRKHERTRFDMTVKFSVIVLEFKNLKNLSLSGKGLNISSKGLCIKTDYPLEPGHVLKFDNGIGHKAGIVKWSTKFDDDYRVGIKFV